MKTKCEKLPNSRVKIDIELSSQEFDKYRERAFLRLSSNTDVKGFRPGKAPREVIEDKIGKDKIFQETLEICLPLSFTEAVKKEKIEPVANPEIKIKKYDENKPFSYTAQIDVLPEIKLPAYNSIKIKKKLTKIGKNDIEASLKELQKAYAVYEDKKEPAVKGDKIEIDFEGFLKGAKIEQLTSKSHPLILGEGGFIKGFEENLKGLKKGEEREFSLKMPAKIRDKFLAEKEVKFKVKVQGVWKVILPKIDEEFAKKLTHGKDLKFLERDLRISLEKRAQTQEEKRLEGEYLEKLAAIAKIELPESLIKNEQTRIFGDIQQDIESRGLPFAKYLESIGKSEENLLQDLQIQAEKSVKIGLVMSEIRKKEKVAVSPEEVELEFEVVKNSGYQIDDEARVKKQIKLNLENKKLLGKLIDKASK